MTTLPTPIRPAPRPRHALADLAALVCALAALALGWAVYTAIHALDVVATTAIADGHQAGLALARVSQDLAGLPLVGATLQGDLAPVQSIPATVTATGYQELQAIGHLALLGGLFVAAVPLLILACTYLPWRLHTGQRTYGEGGQQA